MCLKEFKKLKLHVGYHIKKGGKADNNNFIFVRQIEITVSKNEKVNENFPLTFKEIIGIFIKVIP